MWENIKYNLLHHWTFMRGLRLVLGIIAIVQWFTTYDVLIGIAGMVLLIQAMFNLGCCSTGTCAPTRDTKSTGQTTETIIYEEIK